ncbi:META domain-containing protein [Caballeronia sp. EK]|jgi:heat shock protein HslJ|uniref:META domain-containing protein n=1 Tax=Caballeronia sp. EK TaxID=2767469 RepID=UPI001654FC29|nr:META domain-containing protein [Caballeronia sp. EK]MBC8642623.1 META domain-containing protein [Caballeronia sp. EK]
MPTHFLRASALRSAHSSSNFLSRRKAALSLASRACALVVAASVVTGCAMPKHPDASAPPTDPYNPAATQLLDDTQWELTSWTDASGQPRAVPHAGENDARALTLDFSTANGHRLASGFSGCNRYSGTYDLKDGKLTFGPLAGTRMACVSGAGAALERPYLDALAHIAKSGVQMNPPPALKLTLDDGQVLTFSARAK